MAKKSDEDSVKSVKKIKETKVLDDDISIDITQIRSELTEYMQDKIDREVDKAVEKSTKKLIRYKNSIIIKKNIIIICLLLLCIFLSYNLYKISDLTINIETNKKTSQKQQTDDYKENTKKEQKQEDSFEQKKEKYKKFVDDIYINDDSLYVKDFYNGDLSDEIKLYIALNSISDDKITIDDDSTYIEEKDLQESYDNFFISDFVPKSFDYNNLKFHFLPLKSLFFAEGKFERGKSNIKKDIIDIKEEDMLRITTVEGIVKEDKLYNVITGKEIKNYSGNLPDKKDDLTVITYCFEKVNKDYKFVKIEI